LNFFNARKFKLRLYFILQIKSVLIKFQLRRFTYSHLFAKRLPSISDFVGFENFLSISLKFNPARANFPLAYRLKNFEQTKPAMDANRFVCIHCFFVFG
jgi:hypothetical protein